MTYISLKTLNKKTLVIITVCSVLALFFIFKFFIEDKYSNYIFGKVAEVRENTIIVEGAVTQETSKGITKNQGKKITFVVNENTVITKKATVLDKSKSGMYNPEVIESAGNLSDIKTGLLINISSKDNLLENDYVNALKIIYPSDPIFE